jgi:membrane protease YdiL (CAAX protease family)
MAAPDLAMVARITDEAMNHGEVVDTAAHLTDRIGPRLTNSPGMRAAERWTQDKFKAWGLTNVRTEGFDFGRGWSFDSASVTMVSPRRMSLRTLPVAWTPGTPAAGITAPVIIAPIVEESFFRQWLWRRLEERGLWLTLGVTGATFLLIHLRGPVGMLSLLPLTLLVSFARAKTGSPRFGMWLHGINNFIAVAGAEMLLQLLQ